jgi:NADH-quinone oxidoreductase subunit C
MEHIGLTKKLQDRFPDEVLEIYEHREQVAVLLKRERIRDIVAWLVQEEDMNHLMCLCGVDNSRRTGENLQRFEVVYQLYSINNRRMLRLRAQVPEDDPRIDSVTSFWTGADCLERETYDLMGISFTGHPNLKRILLPDDWQGHPLRKEYHLRGDEEWSGYEELKEKSRALSRYDFRGGNKDS